MLPPLLGNTQYTTEDVRSPEKIYNLMNYYHIIHIDAFGVL